MRSGGRCGEDGGWFCGFVESACVLVALLEFCGTCDSELGLVCVTCDMFCVTRVCFCETCDMFCVTRVCSCDTCDMFAGTSKGWGLVKQLVLAGCVTGLVRLFKIFSVLVNELVTC